MTYEPLNDNLLLAIASLVGKFNLLLFPIIHDSLATYQIYMKNLIFNLATFVQKMCFLVPDPTHVILRNVYQSTRKIIN